MKKRALPILLSLLLLTTGCNPNSGKEDETMPETTEPRPAYSEAALAATPDDGYFEIKYETESYVDIGAQIKLNASFITGSGALDCIYETLTPDIATSDFGGTVTGVSAGLGYVRAFINDDLYFDFPVTVLPADLSDAMRVAVEANNSNIFVRENLGIGAGTPAYYRDIYGSISKVQYNDPLVIDRRFENLNTTSNYGKFSTFNYKIEYITIHYTGNMAQTATAHNNAEYFSYAPSSVHYVTGNDGVYSVLNDEYMACHAGDMGNGLSTIYKPSGIFIDPDGDYMHPEFGVSDNKYFTINGETTTVRMPPRAGKLVFDGSNYMTIDGERRLCITEMGLPFKIVNGEYYIGSTWWCYTQKSWGVICGAGGDSHSLSIESAVNPETDLWYTWHKTAQLTAKLLIDNGLDETRITGHNMWTAKNCPQPMLENNLEIWYEFSDMVASEKHMADVINSTGGTYSMTIIEGQDVTTDTDKSTKVNYNGKNYPITWHPGRVEPSDEATVVVYEVTFATETGTESIQLCSAVNRK